MTARMDLSATAPAAYKAMIALDSRSLQGPLPTTLLDLVKLRAARSTAAPTASTPTRPTCAPRASPSPGSRASPPGRKGRSSPPTSGPRSRLTETMTRLSEGGDRVPTDTWDQAHKAFGDEGMGQLVMVITTINAWNRISVATRMVPESYAD